jgi:hypothetical protein
MKLKSYFFNVEDSRIQINKIVQEIHELHNGKNIL